MTDTETIEYEFHNTPPTWPHPPIIMLKQNGKNYCLGPSIWTWERHKTKDWFNGGGLKNIRHGLWTFGMPDRDMIWFSNQIWKEFMDKMFPKGMPEFLQENE